jgi:hypothetical protein
MGNGQSVKSPGRIAQKNGKAQIRYNITKIEVEQAEGAPQTQYQYDYVEVAKPLTRKAVIDALIRAKHDVNDEFALMALDHNDPEYLEYRQYVAGCKVIADEVLSEA